MEKFGELFAGCGGLGFGLKLAGFDPVWAVDNDYDACKTHSANVGSATWANVEDVVRFDALGKPVQGLAFGFPCNDFSQVGEQKGLSGYYGKLYKHAIRAIKDVKPMWFIAENVPGMMSKGGDSIMEQFAEAGPKYTVTVHQYNFEDYGVPQKRHRIIGVGIRKDLKREFLPPSPTSPVWVTAKQALYNVSSCRLNNDLPVHSEKVKRLISSIPPGENCWHPSVPEELRLKTKCQMSLIYRRLHPDEPSYTIVASGGGGTHGYHYAEPRALTNRERARLQAFPDTFEFLGSPQSVRKQIGMAVPPLAAKHIGEALMAALKGQAYLAIDPSIGVFG